MLVPTIEFMKLSVFFASSVLFSLSANADIGSQMLRFRYLPVEGDEPSSCEHVLVNPESQDWAVRCGKNEFRVHLWVTPYEHPTSPRMSYEILYWVTQLNRDGTRAMTGSTVWFHLEELSKLGKLELMQQIENGSSELELTLDLLK